MIYLKINRISMVALSSEHGHSVVEDIASTLNTLIQPVGTMTLFVDSNRKGLSSAVVYRINKSHIEFVGMFRQMMST
jgi:hypothetical protein